MAWNGTCSHSARLRILASAFLQADGSLGTSSFFTGDGNNHIESTVFRYSVSISSTGGERIMLRSDALVLGGSIFNSPFTYRTCLVTRKRAVLKIDVLPLQTDYFTTAQACGKVEHKHFVESFNLSLIQELLHRFGRQYFDLGSFLWWQLTSDGRVLTNELFRHRLFKSGSAVRVDASDNRVCKSGAVDLSADESSV